MRLIGSSAKIKIETVELVNMERGAVVQGQLPFLEQQVFYLY